MDEKILKKDLVLLFGDICGFTSLSERKKPEEVFLILKEIYKTVEEIIKRNDGKIISYIGDAIFTVFGYPESSLNDFEKMILSCVEINNTLKMNFNILMKFSAHFGNVQVIVDEIGGFDVKGKEADFVKDINKFSGPEKILISENVYKILKNKYPIEILKKINLYNKEFYVYEIDLKELEEKNLYISSLIRIEEKRKEYIKIYQTSTSFEEIFEAGIALINSLIKEAKFFSAYKIIDDLLKKTGEKSIERMKLLNSLAWLYYITGKIDESKKIIEDAMKMSKNIEESKEVINTLINTINISGLIHYRKGEYLSAKKSYIECTEKAKNTQNIKSITPFLTNLGNTYFQMGEFLKAEACHRFSYKLKKESKNFIDLPATSISYANLLIEMGKLGEAERLLEETEKIIKDYSLQVMEIYYHYTLGNLLFSGENGGIEEYQKSLSICSKIDNSFPVPMILSGIGIYNSYHLKDKEKTFKIIEKAISISSEQNNFEYYILSNLALSYALYRFNEKYEDIFLKLTKLLYEKGHFRFLPEIEKMGKLDKKFKEIRIFKYKRNLIIKI